MIQKTIQDYYEEISSEYPDLNKSDIKRILQYGFKSLIIHNNCGGDVCLHQKDFWFYSGQLMNDSLKYFNYYKRKMRVKMRIMYKRWKVEWDGYYYFGLSRKQYDEYLNSKNKKGRPKKNFIFNKVYLYKIFDECNIIHSGDVAIFRIPHPIDQGFTMYKEILKTDKAELILEREPLTFNDVLSMNYNYQYKLDKIHKTKIKNNGKYNTIR